MLGSEVKLESFLKAIDYKVTEGYEPQWDCFKGFYSLCSEKEDEYTASVYFNKSTSKVVVIEYWDYTTDNYYRWVDRLFEPQYVEQHKQGGISYSTACDEAQWIDCFSNDILDKISRAVKGKSSNLVDFELELPDDDLFALMKLAHQRDLTLNQMINEVLELAISFENAKDQDFSDLVDNEPLDIYNKQ